MQEEYKILGVSADATDEEIDQAYRTLRDKYSRERFYEGEIGNQAAKNLTKLENAYAEIKANRGGEQFFGKSNSSYEEVESLIKDKRLDVAQTKLDDITERDAEWHYLQALIFYRKNWTNESKKQLEIAMNMEPNNAKYSQTYTKLKQKTEFNERQFHSGNANYNQQPNNNRSNRQMGGDECGSFCDCCTTMICIDCLCSMCR